MYLRSSLPPRLSQPSGPRGTVVSDKDLEIVRRFHEESEAPFWLVRNIYVAASLTWGVCRYCGSKDIGETALLDDKCGNCWRSENE